MRPQAAKSGGMQPLSEGDAAPLVIVQLALGLLLQLHTANSYFKLRHALLQQEGGAFPGIALSSSIRAPNSHTCWLFPPRALSSSWSWSESPPSREGQRSRIASLVCGLTHLLVSFSQGIPNHIGLEQGFPILRTQIRGGRAEWTDGAV